LSVNSPELIFALVKAKPGTNHSTNPTNPTTSNSGEFTDKNQGLFNIARRAFFQNSAHVSGKTYRIFAKI